MFQAEIEKIKEIVRDIVRQEIAKALAEKPEAPAPPTYTMDVNEEKDYA